MSLYVYPKSMPVDALQGSSKGYVNSASWTKALGHRLKIHATYRVFVRGFPNEMGDLATTRSLAGTPAAAPGRRVGPGEEEEEEEEAWLPDGYSRIFRIICVWPFGLLDYGSATLRCKI